MITDKRSHLLVAICCVYTVAIVTFFGIAVFEHNPVTRIASVIIPRSKRALDQSPKIRLSNKTVFRRDKVLSASDGNVVNRTFRVITHVPTHRMLKGDPKKMKFSVCLFKNCQLFVSRNTRSADAIIIQGSKPSKPLPVRESSKHIMIFASTETPIYLSYVNPRNPFWNKYYNWSMTYRRDADIPYMYGYVYPKYLSRKTVFKQLQTDRAHDKRMYPEYEEDVDKNPSGINNKDYDGIYRRKNVTAAWLVSHCWTASKREEYVKIMNKTINIDIFGKCNKRFCSSRNYTECDEKIIKDTYFYLAFENSLCVDYVTEKVFKWFQKDIVIVARGARNYSVHLPKGTYIDADDFRSPTELAEYLKWLSSNEKEYLKYLKRKDMYKVFQRDTMAQVAFCNLCRKLNNIDIYGKTFDMQKSWSQGSCIARKRINV